MSDQVHKQFVKSFIDYLKQQSEGQSLGADVVESLDVATQCLQAAFNLSDDEDLDGGEAPSNSAGTSSQTKPQKLDLFEMFQSMFIERNPQSLEIAEQIKNEGNRLMKERKYQEALVQYNRAISFDPKNPIFYCNRAAAYIRLTENDRAIKDCNSALFYNPNYSKAYGRMGNAYLNTGKYDEAIDAYTKAIQLEPDNNDYKFNLDVAKNEKANSSQTPTLEAQLTDAMNVVVSNPSFREALFGTSNEESEQLNNLFQFIRTRAPPINELLNNLAQGVIPGQPNQNQNPPPQPPPESES